MEIELVAAEAARENIYGEQRHLLGNRFKLVLFETAAVGSVLINGPIIFHMLIGHAT